MEARECRSKKQGVTGFYSILGGKNNTWANPGCIRGGGNVSTFLTHNHDIRQQYLNIRRIALCVYFLL
jgi:hypothetical protein